VNTPTRPELGNRVVQAPTRCRYPVGRRHNPQASGQITSANGANAGSDRAILLAYPREWRKAPIAAREALAVNTESTRWPWIDEGLKRPPRVRKRRLLEADLADKEANPATLPGEKRARAPETSGSRRGVAAPSGPAVQCASREGQRRCTRASSGAWPSCPHWYPASPARRELADRRSDGPRSSPAVSSVV
jgi:hypothetical protein